MTTNPTHGATARLNAVSVVNFKKKSSRAFKPQYANQFTPLDKRVLRYSVNSKTGCWIWLGNGKDRALIRVNNIHTTAYRMAYLLLVGPIPEGMLVCHKCDNGMCINPEHLFLGTGKDNQRDCLAKGRHSSQKYPKLYQSLARALGKRNTWSFGKPRKHAIIKPEHENEIRKMRLENFSMKAIGARFGVSGTAVYLWLKRRDKWAAKSAPAAAGGGK